MADAQRVVDGDRRRKRIPGDRRGVKICGQLDAAGCRRRTDGAGAKLQRRNPGAGVDNSVDRRIAQDLLSLRCNQEVVGVDRKIARAGVIDDAAQSPCTAKNPVPWMATSVGTPVALTLPWVNNEGKEPT